MKVDVDGLTAKAALVIIKGTHPEIYKNAVGAATAVLAMQKTATEEAAAPTEVYLSHWNNYIAGRGVRSPKAATIKTRHSTDGRMSPYVTKRDGLLVVTDPEALIEACRR